MKLPADEPSGEVYAHPAMDEPPRIVRRALVLSGGGARGAYEIGVVKAILETGVEFDLAFGTSIGGINAAFIAQGSFNRLEELWSSMKATDIFRMPTL